MLLVVNFRSKVMNAGSDSLLGVSIVFKYLYITVSTQLVYLVEMMTGALPVHIKQVLFRVVVSIMITLNKFTRRIVRIRIREGASPLLRLIMFLDVLYKVFVGLLSITVFDYLFFPVFICQFLVILRRSHMLTMSSPTLESESLQFFRVCNEFRLLLIHLLELMT